MQYSPLLQAAVARHEEVAWQVSGPPMVSSLQDVKPVTVEQSDLTEQITEIVYKHGEKIIVAMLTIMTYISSTAIIFRSTYLSTSC